MIVILEKNRKVKKKKKYIDTLKTSKNKEYLFIYYINIYITNFLKRALGRHYYRFKFFFSIISSYHFNNNSNKTSVGGLFFI
jgi:hypothetical protein